MNAPWKAATQGGREAFAAFVCDEAALDVLRRVVADMGWQAETCHRGGLREAVQALSAAASPTILLVDLSDSRAPLDDINGLAEVCEPGTLVIALGQVNDVRLYRDLLSSGIHDYLLKPLSPEAVRETLLAAQEVFVTAREQEPESGRKHVSCAVVGTRGGVGASTVATSLAWLTSTERRLNTALLDLDIHFGTGALALDVEPGRGLTDALDNPSRIDGLFIQRAMIRANENLAVLSAEAPLGAPLQSDGSAFLQLEEEFRQAFDVTVLDLPRNTLIAFPQLLGDANVVVLATDLTLASVRDAIRILSWLKAHAGHARTILVANKVQGSVAEISRADFENSVESKIAFEIPYDAKGAVRAAKLGQTLAEANGSSRVGQALRELAAAVIGVGDEPPSRPGLPATRSLLGRMGKLKRLRPPRKPAG